MRDQKRILERIKYWNLMAENCSQVVHGNDAVKKIICAMRNEVREELNNEYGNSNGYKFR